jgi:hypothetical protein
MIRRWMGSSLLALLGLALEVYGLRENWHPRLLVGIGVIALCGVMLSFPWGRTTRPMDASERRAIVRGDASGSSFERFWVKGADSFVDGDAKNAIFRDIWFKARRGKR